MRNLWRKLPPCRRAAIEILIVAGILLGLAGTAAALNLRLEDAARNATSPAEIGRIRDVVSIIQAFVWALLLLAGGVFAYRKLGLFRDFEPHLTVTHAVSHRPVGQQYRHIAVTATLHNTSKVKVDVQDGYILLAQISPIDDETLVQKYVQAYNTSGGNKERDFEWPLLDISRQPSGENTLVIEPGEIHTELGEFIVSNAVESVLVYSYFYNSGYFDGARSAPGWTASTVYDIVIRR